MVSGPTGAGGRSPSRALCMPGGKAEARGTPTAMEAVGGKGAVAPRSAPSGPCLPPQKKEYDPGFNRSPGPEMKTFAPPRVVRELPLGSNRPKIDPDPLTLDTTTLITDPMIQCPSDGSEVSTLQPLESRRARPVTHSTAFLSNG